MNNPPMTLARFRTLVETYGSESSRWPPKEREAALSLVATSEPARTALAEEAELDRALDSLTAPEPSPALSRKLSEIPGRAHGRQPTRLPLKRLRAPALAWAAAMALGVALGNFGSDEDDALPEAQPATEMSAFEPTPSDTALASLALGLADLEESQ